jgi:hypothetical protein
MADTTHEQAPQGREGSRWRNQQPTSEEIAEWFKRSVALDPALKPENYVSGVTMIPAVSKVRYVAGFSRDGAPIIGEREELSYTPYMRVDTRISYWWDLLAAHPEWLGVVEYVTSPRFPIDFITSEERVAASDGSQERVIAHRHPGALTALVHQLPEGFSLMSVPVGQGYSHFLCCTVRVSLYDREAYEKDPAAPPLRCGRGTKQVPLLIGRSIPYADPSSLMKCETGAFGRALGFAGILVIGSGIASAEDMFEALTQGTPPAQATPANQGPAAPEQAPVRTGAEQQHDEEAALQVRATQLWHRLHEEHPAGAEEFIGWMRSRRLQSLTAANGAQLRGIVKKLERLADEAERADAQAEAPQDEDEPGSDAG